MKFILVLLLFFSFSSQAMDKGNFFNLDMSYQFSKFQNDESKELFTYKGLNLGINYNKLHKISGDIHTYWGLGIEVNDQDNTANNDVESEKVRHISPSLNYRFIWKKFSLLTSYSYTMATHEGTGLRHEDLDFSIHKINLQLSYIKKINPGWYFDLFYRYGTGMVFDLDDDHSYEDHTFGVGLIFQFGDESSLKSKSKENSKIDSNKTSGSKKKNFLDFFLY